jgi:hypothetical protein
MVFTCAEPSAVDATTAADSFFALGFASRSGVSQADAQPIQALSRVFGMDCEGASKKKKSRVTACGKPCPSFEHAQIASGKGAGKMLALRVAARRPNGGEQDGRETGVVALMKFAAARLGIAR